MINVPSLYKTVVSSIKSTVHIAFCFTLVTVNISFSIFPWLFVHDTTGNKSLEFDIRPNVVL